MRSRVCHRRGCEIRACLETTCSPEEKNDSSKFCIAFELFWRRTRNLLVVSSPTSKMSFLTLCKFDVLFKNIESNFDVFISSSQTLRASDVRHTAYLSFEISLYSTPLSVPTINFFTTACTSSDASSIDILLWSDKLVKSRRKCCSISAKKLPFGAFNERLACRMANRVARSCEERLLSDVSSLILLASGPGRMCPRLSPDNNA
mmetsp:Transcript_14385/g.21518  ORF Transcript_14385/g.21518 Transcript_14385/m.21518 type:complete len:204 (-) Transcript_14385:654-1265(-)